MCICSGIGQLAHMCHSNLVDAVRPFLRLIRDKAVGTAPEAGARPAKGKKSKARLMMEQSELILELRPKRQASQAPSSGEVLTGWAALEAQFEAMATASSTEWGSTSESLWFFVGYANFKVYDFTFLVLEFLDEECDSDGVLQKVFLHVPDESLHVSRSRMALADLVDFQKRWRAVWWQLDNRQKMLDKDDFVPDVLEVLPLNPELLPVFTIWQGQAEEELRRKRSAPRRSGGGGGHDPGGPPGGSGGCKPQVAGSSRSRPEVLQVRKSRKGPAEYAAAVAAGQEDADGNDPPLLDAVDAGADDEDNESEADWEILADAAEAFAECADDEGEAGEAAQPPEVEPEPSSSVGGPGSALRDLRTAVEALASAEDLGPAEPAAVHLPSAPEPRDGPADASSRVKTVKEESFPVWRLGSIRYNPRSQTYTAFCSQHGEGCKRNRTCKAPSTRSSRPGQGRPLGQLLAWLKDAKNFSDAEQHVHGSTVHLDYESRRAARISFLALPGALHFARHERARAPGESDEPRVVS
ncbi:unnamed protein product [Symbiodinium sp. CCMP2456]|nr:unnamed protein product [Symbiodinium sp. CCMP2456]